MLTATLGVLTITPLRAGAAQPAWTVLPQPWGAGVTIGDVCAFPPAGVAVSGTGARVALSVDGGFTWDQRGPDAQGAALDITALDFSDESHGVVVGAAGLLLVTSDGGLSWRSPPVQGGSPRGDLLDVDLAGQRGYAVGRAGAMISTTDGGASWVRVPAVTGADLTSVALCSNGVAVAGGAGGEVLTGDGASWQLVTVAGTPISGTAAAATMNFADSWPDLIVGLGTSLLGSTDGSSFTWSLASGGQEWSALAYAGRPSGTLLLAGPGGQVDTADASVTPPAAIAGEPAGSAAAVTAAAPGEQSVAYVLGADGQLRRTLNAARSVTAPLPAPGKAVKAGTRVTIRPGPVRVAAPGSLVLEGKVPTESWRVLHSWPWSSEAWGDQPSVALTPMFNVSYRVSFVYGGRPSLISDVTPLLRVGPRLTPNRLSYSLRRGAVYRFSGKVLPALAGEAVQLWTDRRGPWHRIDIGGTVRVSSGGTWASRRFGTPVREKYHLQARIAGTARHERGRSRVVTVTVK